MIYRLARWFDERLGAASFAKQTLSHIFPKHFSFMLGEIALYSFVVLVLTGIYLTTFYEPSGAETVYEGSYEPLVGVPMSEAYRSVVELSWDVRFGLLMRQAHHWGALVFVAAIVAHLSRIFFTGAFRKPREINWMVGVTLLAVVLIEGFAGYSLLDDLLSGLGLRIAYSIIESVPVVGAWLAFITFGGEFPGDFVLRRLYALHIFALPAIIAALIAVHLGLIFRQKHTHMAARGRVNHRIYGEHLWPGYTAKTLSLFFFVFAALVTLGGMVQINPVWLYGPYDVSTDTFAAQPDWYLGWIEGALRIFPAWELRLGGYTVANPFFPAVLLPLLTFLALYMWPFAERWATADIHTHHTADRPRDHPVRTGIGAGALSFYVVLFFAGGDDVIAFLLGVSVNGIVWTFRIAAVLLPPLTGVIAYQWCKGLAAETEVEEAAEEETAEEEAEEEREEEAAAAVEPTAVGPGGPAAPLASPAVSPSSPGTSLLPVPAPSPARRRRRRLIGLGGAAGAVAGAAAAAFRRRGRDRRRR